MLFADIKITPVGDSTSIIANDSNFRINEVNDCVTKPYNWTKYLEKQTLTKHGYINKNSSYDCDS